MNTATCTVPEGWECALNIVEGAGGDPMLLIFGLAFLFAAVALFAIYRFTGGR